MAPITHLRTNCCTVSGTLCPPAWAHTAVMLGKSEPVFTPLESWPASRPESISHPSGMQSYITLTWQIHTGSSPWLTFRNSRFSPEGASCDPLLAPSEGRFPPTPSPAPRHSTLMLPHRSYFKCLTLHFLSSSQLQVHLPDIKEDILVNSSIHMLTGSQLFC